MQEIENVYQLGIELLSTRIFSFMLIKLNVDIVTGGIGDPLKRIERSFAKILGYLVKNEDTTRTLYDQILKENGSSSEIWMEYIQYEKHV